MEAHDLYSTWVEIDLSAIEGNVHYIREKTGVQVMAVVKANGYGHGAVQVASAALRGGAAWCGVARLEEALELRKAGLSCPILLLGYTPPARFGEAIASQASLTVWSGEQVRQAEQAASRLGVPAKLHLKVDTGMSRLGVQPEEALDLSRALAASPWASFEGIFTHFARADEPDQAATRQQTCLFQETLQSLEKEGLKPPFIHAANSAASLEQSQDSFNLVRLGIAMYGLQPSSHWDLPGAIRPALSWKAVLSQVKTLPAGRGVSYGHTYTTRGSERIGTVPVGYADGFRRTQGNQALVGGQKVPVVGRVCMDQVMVQLDAVPEAQAGDEVVLIGRQGQAALSAEEVARIWGTINYEVVCGISPRVPRIYLD